MAQEIKIKLPDGVKLDEMGDDFFLRFKKSDDKYTLASTMKGADFDALKGGKKEDEEEEKKPEAPPDIGGMEQMIGKDFEEFQAIENGEDENEEGNENDDESGSESDENQE